MLGSYIKTSARSIVRNSLFSSINIVGLAISMSVGLLMIVMLSDLFSYDKFHENGDRIWRITSNYQFLDQKEDAGYASTSLKAGLAVKETFTGIEDVAIFGDRFDGDVKYGDKTVVLTGHWANESVFNVFTFPMLAGNPKTALKDPYSVVVTETTAKKLFGDVDPMGKSLQLLDDDHDKNVDYVVTGVVKDVPRFSHVRFDVLMSLSTHENIGRDRKESDLKWDDMWNYHVYLLLPEHPNLEALQSNLDALSERENKTVKNTTIALSLQSLNDIAFGEDKYNEIGSTMVDSNVWMIGVLTFVVILSACFNYTNLSIARSLRRSREVGIRKVVGALKGHVLAQFVTEAVIIALLALVFSFVIFMLFKPYFLSLNENYGEMLRLELSLKVIGYFILFAVGVGIMAGFFPALFFARLNAIKVLKNMSSGKFRNVVLRKVLIVAQFTISLMFITATIIGYKHYKEILAFDLGFNTENVLNIDLRGNKPELLMKELQELPEVKQQSLAGLITSVGWYWGTVIKYNDPHDSVFGNHTYIDENYIPLLEMKLLAGRNFEHRKDSAKESEVIVNEQTLKRFNIGNNDPQKAIGEILTVGGLKLQIIGVVNDFQYGRSTDKKPREIALRYISDNARYLNVKITSTDLPATMAKIETIWRKVDNVHPIEARFYDENIEQAYLEYSSKIKIIGSLSFLAICIASIGLLGMVVFTTETRLKEISIRKVLGASESNLIFLMSKGFLLLLAIATVIAIPATRFYFVKYALSDYTDDAPSSIVELVIGVLSIITLALTLIAFQTHKVARTNPAEVLKNE